MVDERPVCSTRREAPDPIVDRPRRSGKERPALVAEIGTSVACMLAMIATAQGRHPDVGMLGGSCNAQRVPFRLRKLRGSATTVKASLAYETRNLCATVDVNRVVKIGCEVSRESEIVADTESCRVTRITCLWRHDAYGSGRRGLIRAKEWLDRPLTERTPRTQGFDPPSPEAPPTNHPPAALYPVGELWINGDIVATACSD
jgi:hypothetical protein